MVMMAISKKFNDDHQIYDADDENCVLLGHTILQF